jgi:hypothetical protein
MKNRPFGNELLTVARRTLLDELLPLLPPEKAYEALMVAKAMAIAARELEQLGRETHDEQIEQFYRLADLGVIAEATEQGLADQIRKKAIGLSHHGALHQLLLSLTRAKLAITNPKYLNK